MDHEAERKRSTPAPGRGGEFRPAADAGKEAEKGADAPPDADTLARWFREAAPSKLRLAPPASAFQSLANTVADLWTNPIPEKRALHYPEHEAALLLLEAIPEPLRMHRNSLARAEAMASAANDAATISRANRVVAHHARAVHVLQTVMDLLPEAMDAFGDPARSLLHMKAEADAAKAGGPKRKTVLHTPTPQHLAVFGLAMSTAHAWSSVSQRSLSTRRGGRLVSFIRLILSSLPKPMHPTPEAIEQFLKRCPDWDLCPRGHK